MDLQKLLEKGQGQMAVAKDQEELDSGKYLNHRGGNSGCVTEEGEILGNHLATIARRLGIQIPVTGEDRAHHFFDVGLGIEDRLEAKFKEGHDGVVLTEENIPVVWDLDGRSVTGRPDFVLCDHDSKPVQGIELKTVCSANTAKRVWFQHLPETKHVCQAAHYAWKLNPEGPDVPWTLLYISPVKYAVPYTKALTGKFLEMVEPFHYQFHLWFDTDGKLWYNNQRGDEIQSPITKQGIEDFYRLVDECLKKKTLATRMSNLMPDGSESPYDKTSYCKYHKIADEVNWVWDDWVAELKQIKLDAGYKLPERK